MASPKVVMASTSTTNPDLPRQSSICSISTIIADLQHADDSRNFASMNMDDLLKNMYPSSEPPPPQQQQQQQSDSAFPAGGGLVDAGGGGASISRQGSYSLPKAVGSRTVEEVWKAIVAGGESDRRPEDRDGGGGGGGGGLEEMTLEDFLTKAGAVREEDVRVPQVVGYGGQFQMQSQGVEAPMIVAYGNGSSGRGTAGRGKRRAVEEPLDKATQQKQRRMIKNRESAARSRERKQAYTIELESLVTRLEEENARLLREEAEQKKERFKQLMENLIPMVEKQKQPRVLRRVHSMSW
ncbi:bZIP transcription factor 12 isoform X1 [Ziziphus jujuba]|uniref:BZIP transcription factor 12 isoform X1 n=2 Tax=Ziziphus jujuba TaxID=326968 RepID=A0ABM4AI84_ZIZJJ|nr:bZIP transcription factor 12-like isoform X1 [Ziziphus jujuba var. spinosa]XP_048336802.1 bZIP transcription factor 12-like isoform X1 [Ziziphus jujuba var. spinosa]XP_060676427.1 bZIP transcription factor 12 isoform X1 [Ziziphus jujuba]KAH7518577.1 hypothetical protein FEM48_Zijuj09G0186200 [Ziziphus jujuba var. spinosa]